MNVLLPVTITIVGSLITLVGMLIVLNLRSIKKCIVSLNKQLDGHESRIIAIERGHVDKEDWVRSEALNRNKLDLLSVSLGRIEGKLQVVEKLPEIAGAVAREVVSQLNRRKGGPG